MPASARIVLVLLIGLLLVILGALITMAVFLRKRPSQRGRARGPLGSSAGTPATDTAGVPFHGVAADSVGSLEGVAVEARGASASCPTCRREFEGGLVFCPHDARRLVPASEMDRVRGGGSVCPQCRRAFDPGVRFCPHDAAELVPITLYEATRGNRPPTAPTGVHAKICPQCRERFDLAATFCGKDGSELLTVN